MFKFALVKSVVLMSAVCLIAGCVSIQPLEPIKNPPLEYRNDTIVPVEFVHPMQVGFRCAERGAKFMSLPGINSSACASPDLVTMPNPCLTVTGGWYADMLCHELAHANGWSPNHEGGNWLPDSVVHGTDNPEYIMASADEADTKEAEPAEPKHVDESPEAPQTPEILEAEDAYEFNFKLADLSDPNSAAFADIEIPTLPDYLATNKAELSSLTSYELPLDVEPLELGETPVEQAEDVPSKQSVSASAGWSALAGEGLNFMLGLLR